MNERIWELFRQANHPHPKHGGNDMFFPEEFAELIITECCDWIDGSPANDAGQLHLTKSFIIANLKGMFRSKE